MKSLPIRVNDLTIVDAVSHARGVRFYPIEPPITLTPGRWVPVIENGRVVRFDPLPMEPQASDDSD